MNVLLITTDQQRADSIGAYGNRVCQTPNLDTLAAAGTRFSAARTQNPYCQPSRATILTGEYPSTHGVTSNGIDLPVDAVTRSLATRFGDAGHRTAFFGKAHFASTFPVLPTGALESVDGSAAMAEDWTGPYAGFDHAELILFGHMLRIAPLMGQWNWCFGPPPFGLHYARYLFRDGHDKGVERLRLMQPEAAGRTWDHTQTWANQLPEEDHPTTWVAERAIDWLHRVDGPFFAWVSFTDPHHPMDPPAPWAKMYAPADVAEVLWEPHPEEFDTKPAIQRRWSQGPGRNTPLSWANPGGATLTREELATMVAGYYGMVSQLDAAIGRVLAVLDERGLREDTLVIATTDHGEFLGDHQLMFKGPIHYESLVRVPLIVRGPGFAAGAVVEEPVGTIDIAPTALGAAGLVIPATVEGRPLLDGPREFALVENDHQMVATIRLRTIATKRYKLNRYLDTGAGELYDLGDDPLELVNRWDDPGFASVRDDLLGLLSDATAHPVRSEPMVGVVG